MTPKRPLAERLKQSRYWRRRYARDPEFRLRRVNRERERAGKPPLTSVDEIGLDMSRVARAKPRGPDGRFV